MGIRYFNFEFFINLHNSFQSEYTQLRTGSSFHWFASASAFGSNSVGRYCTNDRFEETNNSYPRLASSLAAASGSGKWWYKILPT